MLVSKLIDSEEKKILNDKINLKQLLPCERKKNLELNEKINDMKIKIENAGLHMSRPWEHENQNENENNLIPVSDPWIVTHSNSNLKGEKDKKDFENYEDDIVILHQSNLSSHVCTVTDRARTLRRSVESIDRKSVG